MEMPVMYVKPRGLVDVGFSLVGLVLSLVKFGLETQGLLRPAA